MSAPDFHKVDDLMAIADATCGLEQPIPFVLTDAGKYAAAAANLAPVVQLHPDEPPTLVLDLPADPAESDREVPEDLMECEECSGQGRIEFNILFGIMRDRDCVFCGGTGERTRP